MLNLNLFQNRLTADTARSVQLQGFANGDLTFQPIQFTGKYVTLLFFLLQRSNLDWSVYTLALRISCSTAPPALEAPISLMVAKSPTSKLVSVWRILGVDRRSHWPHAQVPPNTTSVHPDLLEFFFWLTGGIPIRKDYSSYYSFSSIL